MIVLDAKKRVAKGATYLDQIRPGWESSVDPKQLNIGDEDLCVLGQLYGNYFTAIDLLKTDIEFEYEHGFLASQLNSRVLTFFWKRLLKNRAKDTPSRELVWMDEIADFPEAKTVERDPVGV